MILVPHYVDRSAIEGLGLFCAEPLKAGQAIYRYDWRFVMVITETELRELPPAMQQAVLKYSYRGRGSQRLSGAMYYCADDARFMNHSDEPSTLWRETEAVYVAAYDLPAGTELSCDYRDFCEPQDCEFEL